MTHDTTMLDSPDAIREHLASEVATTGFAHRGVRLVLCGQHNQVLLHCHVGDVPPTVSDEECALVLNRFAEALGGGANGAMLLALTRPGPLTLTDSDGQWFRVAHAVCDRHEVRVLGVHLVTPHGQREVVLDDAL